MNVDVFFKISETNNNPKYLTGDLDEVIKPFALLLP